MELSERKLKILQAVIADFISTAEPVGSRTLSKNHDMGLSPATIRNEMSDLEDMGYLTHPHASAGRGPSDKAYRLYVDKLMNTRDLPDEMKKRISEELESGEAPDAVAKKAAEILKRLITRGVAKFRNLFLGSKSRSEIVATFLAVLELCRLSSVALGEEKGEMTVTYLKTPEDLT